MSSELQKGWQEIELEVDGAEYPVKVNYDGHKVVEIDVGENTELARKIIERTQRYITHYAARMNGNDVTYHSYLGQPIIRVHNKKAPD